MECAKIVSFDNCIFIIRLVKIDRIQVNFWIVLSLKIYDKNCYNFKKYIIFLIIYVDTCAKYTMYGKIIYFS